MYDMPLPNKIVGMTHGILFIAYCILVYAVNKENGLLSGSVLKSV